MLLMFELMTEDQLCKVEQPAQHSDRVSVLPLNRKPEFHTSKKPTEVRGAELKALLNSFFR